MPAQISEFSGNNLCMITAVVSGSIPGDASSFSGLRPYWSFVVLTAGERLRVRFLDRLTDAVRDNLAATRNDRCRD
jgi:hypothetical protein